MRVPLPVGVRVRVAEKGDICDGLEGTVVSVRTMFSRRTVYEVRVDVKKREGYYYFIKNLDRVYKGSKKKVKQVVAEQVSDPGVTEV